MEPTVNRITQLESALDRLGEALDDLNNTRYHEVHVHIRNSVIKSFEFSYDLFWKTLKDVLEVQCGLAVANPRDVFKESFTQKIISEHEFELLKEMIRDRNETSHRYDEKMAESIATNVPEYYDAMQAIAERLIAGGKQ